MSFFFIISLSLLIASCSKLNELLLAPSLPIIMAKIVELVSINNINHQGLIPYMMLGGDMPNGFLRHIFEPSYENQPWVFKFRIDGYWSVYIEMHHTANDKYSLKTCLYTFDQSMHKMALTGGLWSIDYKESDPNKLIKEL